MEYKTEILEAKTSISTGDGGSVNKHRCMLEESTSVTLSDGRIVTVPKASTIHSGALIGYSEYSHRMYINDLNDCSNLSKEEITIKLRIKTPILPHYVPNFMKGILTDIFTKTSIIPYFSCDCWTGSTARTIEIYGKERFEEHNKMREEYIKFITRRLPDGEFIEVSCFCPYYGGCISEFNEKICILNTGEEISKFDANMIEINRMVQKREEEMERDRIRMKERRENRKKRIEEKRTKEKNPL